MPASRSERSLARMSSSSSGMITSPSAPIRSTASTVCSRAASGSGFGQMIQPARPPGTNERAICRTCRNPAVVTRPTRAPLPSRIALVATVVPCRTWPIASTEVEAAAQTFSMPVSTPTDWSCGVDWVLARYDAPLSSSINRMSVKVPPTSTPNRNRIPSLLSDHAGGGQPAQLVVVEAEEAPVDVVVAGAERRAGRPDAARRGGQLGEDVLHGDLAEPGVGQPDDRIARREVRVLEHVLGPVDPPGRHAGPVQGLEQLVGVEPGRPVGDQRVEFFHVLATRAVRGEPLVGDQVRSPHDAGQPREHA